jgi:hypothetical protein
MLARQDNQFSFKAGLLHHLCCSMQAALLEENPLTFHISIYDCDYG